MKLTNGNSSKNQVILTQDGSPFIPQYPSGINYAKCTGCGECVEICPQNCIELIELNDRKVASITKIELCIGDGFCKIVCPEDAFL
ncbi:4Fe-4S dicluster domain-containing protein [Balnearium lithotrophicum]|uniref:4Fe-4S dicluster domain-containing protein n=1 Tax=Balnearium lithotrophicum TaxID=223788 RepID=A0A521BRV8_9BACT|nr:4Fe-4S binding protein [Balnearium lithotrophicum]SMO49839.1 4Fe-4S dicluster domain-containing protein [Balnearium lithotrophicum]